MLSQQQASSVCSVLQAGRRCAVDGVLCAGRHWCTISVCKEVLVHKFCVQGGTGAQIPMHVMHAACLSVRAELCTAKVYI